MNTKNLNGVSWQRNMLDNIKIMKDAGVSRDKILELTLEARNFAKDLK